MCNAHADCKPTKIISRELQSVVQRQQYSKVVVANPTLHAYSVSTSGAQPGECKDPRSAEARHKVQGQALCAQPLELIANGDLRPEKGAESLCALSGRSCFLPWPRGGAQSACPWLPYAAPSAL